jgi:hypothetical protein
MALNMQNSIDSENSNQENKPRNNNKMKKTPHAYTRKKRNLKQPSQSHPNSRFNL